MDKKKSNADKLSRKQPCKDAVPLIGNWAIEKNFPYGFVIHNADPNSNGTEYHFWHNSNGWFTAKGKNKEAQVFGLRGEMNLTPVLCDRQSTARLERISYLRSKGQELSESEAKELLALSGLIKGGR